MTALANDADQIRKDFINSSYLIDYTLMILPNTFHHVHHSGKHEDVRDHALSRGFPPGDRDSIPEYSVLGLGCTKWHWDGLFSEYLSFPLSVQFH